MDMTDVAEEFRLIALNQTVDGLKLAMNVTAIPKRVVDATHLVDPIEKCMWILEKRFNCGGFRSLNVERLNTSHALAKGLCTIQLPVILSVVGKESLYKHVVVAWRKKIIDFETSETYLVTAHTVDRICGPKNLFVRVSRAYMLRPSKAMKRAVEDYSDWGEADLLRQFSFLFKK